MSKTMVTVANTVTTKRAAMDSANVVTDTVAGVVDIMLPKCQIYQLKKCPS